MTPADAASALAGGGLIGLSAVALMAVTGRIAGVSGILARLLSPQQSPGAAGRLAFVAGVVVAPLVAGVVSGQPPVPRIEAGSAVLVIAGLLVGFGAVWGNGCTSGHGVCGLARLSIRSVVATALFMTTAIATVLITRHML